MRWYEEQWRGRAQDRARRAVARGVRPVAGFSVYTWNVEVFLELIRLLKVECPELLVIVGGPQVQRPEDYLARQGIDLVVLGEGEVTFTELLDDGVEQEGWPEIRGIAYVPPGPRSMRVARTAPRPPATDLDHFPAALEVVPLRDTAGRPQYERMVYETSRGCPFRCAFCEWGTGATGVRMYQHSLARIKRDVERMAAGGVAHVFIADSNFGALAEDLAKAEIFAEMRRRTGLPESIAINWAKGHTGRTRTIARLLHQNGLLVLHPGAAVADAISASAQSPNQHAAEPVSGSRSDDGRRGHPDADGVDLGTAGRHTEAPRVQSRRAAGGVSHGDHLRLRAVAGYGVLRPAA